MARGERLRGLQRRHPYRPASLGVAEGLTGIIDVFHDAARVAMLADRLADDARVKAYEILGELARAVGIMQRRLRADG